MSVTVGIHCSAGADGRFTADGNVAVLVDGELAFAVAEERVTRRKYDGGFRAALRYSLETLNLATANIDAVAVSTFGRPDVADDPEFQAVEQLVRAVLGDGPTYSVIPSHHLVHALTTIAQCPYERCLVAVIDNEGSILGPRRFPELWRHRLERTSYYLLEGDRLALVARDHDDPGEVGYGKVYSKVTRYCGFRSYQEAGKTMALAAFGDRDRFQAVRLFEHTATGRARTAMRNSTDGLQDLADFFCRADEVLPPPRQAGEPFDQAHLDLAAWCQVGLQESVARRMAGLAAEHRVATFGGAGGVFLNSVMNRHLQEVLDTPDVFVPPSPGDAGLALGAAVWSQWQSTGALPRFEATPYLGWIGGEAEIDKELRAANGVSWHRVDDPVKDAVNDLAAGRIVGWFQDRSEYGPRALGNRSFLANPGSPWVRELLNNRVKNREWFRPYAPVVAQERAADTYEVRSPVPHMMHVAPARAGAARLIPGGVHVDGSARLQTVTASQNPTFHRLVTAFSDLTGIPSILNTSFNVDGMPIVETPADALECFRRAPAVDALYLGSTRVVRAREGGK